MRVFLKLSILLACCMLVAADEDTTDEEKAWQTGGVCNTCACQDRSSNFNKESFCVFSYFPLRAYKMLWSFTPTNFVIYIRNIEKNNHGQNYLQICGGELNCQYLSSTEDQVLVFTDTTQVIMYTNMYTSFDVQYYAGCDLFDETDVVIEREAGSLFTQPGYCWIVIPRLYNEATTQHTAATNIFLSHVNVPENSTLSLKNILTGELLLNFKNYTNFDLTRLDKSEEPIIYQTNKYISSIFLFNVEICPPAMCIDISFEMKVQAFSDDDSQCFRRKQTCLYGLPEEDFNEGEDEVNCEDEEENTCEAFEKFEEIVLSSGPQADGSGDEEGESRAVAKTRRSRCKWHYRMKEKKYFCRKDKKNKTKFSPDCGKFGVCALYCIEQRVFRKICGKSLRIFH